MAHSVPQGKNLLYGWRKAGRFSTGVGAELPPAYLKFWAEWKHQEPTAVHWIPKEGRFERNEQTGEVSRVQNVPIPVVYPKEHDEGIWGGEGIVKGFQKRAKDSRRVAHFWMPALQRTVVHSRVLDQYISVVVTLRTLDLIHENHGFDHYILKTPACDLKSLLALKIKRQILQELKADCPSLAKQPEKLAEVLSEFKDYAEPYTEEEIEWYGLSYREAIKKKVVENRDAVQTVPLKHAFRSKLLQQLKDAGLSEVEHVVTGDGKTTYSGDKTSSWLSKINPFAKK